MSSAPKTSDVRVIGTELYLIPVKTRMPIKFGPEVFTEATYARVKLTVRDRQNNIATGWGETPLSVQWCWPSSLTYQRRHDILVDFCQNLAVAWSDFESWGHPLEVGSDFLDEQLSSLRESVNQDLGDDEQIPYLAALICCSLFDLALHDAYGKLVEKDIYETYTPEYLNRDLAAFLAPVEGSGVAFQGKYPSEYLRTKPLQSLPAWHLIGGLDPLTADDLTGNEPDDGYPVILTDWIKRDGLNCLKIKLRGNDAAWDYDRIVRVGQIAIEHDVTWLTADFNCTVSEPEYVTAILDQLRDEHPRTYAMLLYVEQPFPYDLEQYSIDARSVAARKPVFLDESAHDWKFVRLGRELGWSGVALKTCKTQSGAILSNCWARAHGMPLMVQDLANGLMAQISHLRLGSQVETIMGIETNSMQFYPDASKPEAKIHPGMYRRQNGCVDLSTLGATGMGYRLDEIKRELPPPAITCELGSIK
ncbi:MAG: mandelate racemase/muconate lactonizing enzyme family protein [Planctomycetaceae bacterium]|nr:mandelate racemase/muconate lactonizing enzyme family protein [Planctomycetaceae bacterium]